MRLHMRLGLLFLVLLSVGSAMAAPPTTEQLPEVLRDWQAWTLHGEEYRGCPAAFDADHADADSFICAWPGELRIDVGADGASFTQAFETYARTFVTLPGDTALQPLAVTVDGNDAAVVLHDDTPGLWLDAGRHTIAGQFRFVDRPESLKVPVAVARVTLTVDGRTVFPVNRSGDQLWLGRAERASVEADALGVQVFRLLADGIPAQLDTRLVFEVSGKGREEVLPAPLPAGFEPIMLAGDLPARIESDGRLHVQVRPGTFTVQLRARALAPLSEVVQTVRPTPWPAQEVWSYAADGSLRVSEAGGPPQIDPNLAEVPADWRTFPAFMMEGEATLVVTESSRGMASADGNRLNLSRQLWLDFDGGGWTLKDQINGSMKKDWRLDVREPIVLGRATEQGEPSLITRSIGNKAIGVEVRSRELSLATTAREETGTYNLPVTGWAHTFDTVGTTLQLPPGYRLWAALGIDSAPRAWLDQWDLLDVFFAVLTVVLFAVCFGRLAAIVPIAYVALAWHEPDAPRATLLIALALLAIVRSIDQEGRFSRFMGWIARGFAVLVVVLAVPFMVGQIRYGLYPQLLADASYPGRSFDGSGIVFPASQAPMEEPYMSAEPVPQAAPAPVAEAMQDTDNVARKEMTLGGANRQALAKRMKRFESGSVVFQNGYAEPNWDFSGYQLNIQGPVDANQNMRLLITPPWLTSALRFVLVAALAWILVVLAMRQFRRGKPGRRLGFGVVLLAAGFAVQASEPPVPPADVLAELGERLREAPDCAPNCARVAEAEVIVDGERLELALNVHAAVRTAIPLPGEGTLLAIESLALDGVPVAHVSARSGGQPWIVVGRGVHRVQMAARIANVASIDVVFPMAPAWVTARAQGWDVSGIQDGRLNTGALNLTRVIDGGGQAAAEVGVAQRFAPFVRVTRQLDFDVDWSVSTTVERLAPAQGAFTIELPLVAGERVLSADLKVADGRITLPFAEDASWVVFESRLDTVPSLELDAPDLAQRAEVWRIRASPSWNVMVGGLPGIHPQDNQDLFEFHPLPKERLNVQVTRPEALPGGTIAFDSVSLQSRFAKRSVEHELNLQWRATQGGQHGIVLPPDAEVLSVTINGQLLNLRPEKQVLRLPVTPGSGSVQVLWREVGEGSGWRMRSPVVDLKAPASNIQLGIAVPGDRWLLSANGPRLGPAVLYWGELLAMVLIAIALSRSGRSGLRLHEWLLLGIGFSTVSWFALVVFAAWLFVIDWRRRSSFDGWFWKFDLLQLAFVFLTLAALVSLFVALSTGLVGQPDLHVISRGYGANDLKWFHDLSDSLLPQGEALTLPIWVYRAVMLAWAFWMAWSLVRWGKAALAAFLHGGVWQPLLAPKAATAAATSAPVVPREPAAAAAAGNDKPAAASADADVLLDTPGDDKAAPPPVASPPDPDDSSP